MKIRIVLVSMCLALFMGLGGRAFADDCVVVDTASDNLAPADQKAAVMALRQAMGQQGIRTNVTNCQATWQVSHVKLGSSITVALTGPMGYRQGTARNLDELPAIYSQMVKSFVTGQPMNTSGDNIDRTNVTMAQMAPMRAEADSLWYLRLGYGLVMGGDTTGGPAFGFGYRYELDNLAIDVSFLNLVVTSSKRDANGNSSGGVNGSWAKLAGLYFLNPLANRSSYFGAGLSWGGTAIVKSDAAYSGSGLQGELTIGYELLRASTIRFFLQADAIFPFYKADSLDFVYSSTTGMSSTTTDSIWAPTFVFSLAMGWGRNSGGTVVRVVQ